MNKQIFSLTYLEYRLQQIYIRIHKNEDEDTMGTEIINIFAILVNHLNLSRERELFGMSPQKPQKTKKKRKSSKECPEHSEIKECLILEFLSYLFLLILKYSLSIKSHHIHLLNRFLQDYIDTLGEASTLKIIIQNKLVEQIHQFYSQIKPTLQKQVKTMQKPPELQQELMRLTNTLLRLISQDKIIQDLSNPEKSLEKEKYLKIRGQVLLLQTHILSFFHRSGVKASEMLVGERRKKEEKRKIGRLSTKETKQLLENYRQTGEWNTDQKLIEQLNCVHDIMSAEIGNSREDVEMLKKMGTTLLDIIKKIDFFIKQQIITDQTYLDSINEYPVSQVHNPFLISSLIRNPIFWGSFLFQIIIYSRIHQANIILPKNDLNTTTFSSRDIKQSKQSLSSIIKNILKGIYSISIQCFIHHIYPKLISPQSQEPQQKDFSARKALLLIESILSNERKWENLKQMTYDKLSLLDAQYYADDQQKNRIQKIKQKEVGVQILQKQLNKSIYDELATQEGSHISHLNASSMIASIQSTPPKHQNSNKELMRQILKKTGVKTSKLFKFLNSSEIKESFLPKTIKCSLQLTDPLKSLPKYEQQIQQFSNSYKEKSQSDITQFWGTKRRYNINEWRFLRQLYKYSMMSVINLKKKPKKSRELQENEDDKRKFWYINYFDQDSQSLSQASASKRLKKETTFEQ